MNIDSHQHFWHYDPGRDAWNTDEMSALKRDFLSEDLILPLPANHVEGSIAVQAAQSEAETTFLLELAGRFDEIKGVVGWVDFCSPNLPVGQLQQFDSGEISPWASRSGYLQPTQTSIASCPALSRKRTGEGGASDTVPGRRIRYLWDRQAHV